MLRYSVVIDNELMAGIQAMDMPTAIHMAKEHFGRLAGLRVVYRVSAALGRRMDHDCPATACVYEPHARTQAPGRVRGRYTGAGLMAVDYGDHVDLLHKGNLEDQFAVSGTALIGRQVVAEFTGDGILLENGTILSPLPA